MSAVSDRTETVLPALSLQQRREGRTAARVNGRLVSLALLREIGLPFVVHGRATGTAEVFVNLATQSVTYTVNVFNLPSGAVGGHFHVGGPGVGGPVVVDLAPGVVVVEQVEFFTVQAIH